MSSIKPPKGGTGVVPPRGDISTAPARAMVAEAAQAILHHSCGHPIDLKGLVTGNCGSCAAKNRQERLARWKGKKREQAESKNQRLPDGSEFHVKYDSGKKLWSGELVCFPPGDGKTFSAEASGVFRLLSELDAKYRAWVTEKEKVKNSC
jgi:hypothetical protein